MDSDVDSIADGLGFLPEFASASASTGRPGDSDGGSMATLLAAAPPPSWTNTVRLKGTDALKHAIMTDARMSCTKTTDTGEYRNWLLGKFRNKVPDLAGVIKQAAEELADVGLLKEDKDIRKRGRKVQFYRKLSWDDLTSGAKSEAERLQIPRSVFE